MDEERGPFRYCPRCACEYRQGFDLCTDCGVDLVDDPALAGAAAETPALDGRDVDITSIVGANPVAVFTTGSEVQAHVVRGLLVDAAIPAQVFSSGFGAYLGHASTVGLFAHRVVVHPEDEAEAREIIAAADVVPGPGR